MQLNFLATPNDQCYAQLKVLLRGSGTMVQGQQFTPPQLLEAGHRAETEGRLELAAQFYRHLTEYYAFTPEAAEARNGLGRVSTAPYPLWQLNGAGHANEAGANEARYGNGATRPQRRRPIAPRDHYRTGRMLCRLLTTIGWLAVSCGLGAPILLTGLDQIAQNVLPHVPLTQVLSSAAGLVGIGLVVLLSGQIARAVFDQANAVRDLVALERAKLWSD